MPAFCRGERRKYAGKKSRLNRGSNSQPPGHESDTLTTEPPGRGISFGAETLDFVTEEYKLFKVRPLFTIFLASGNERLSLYFIVTISFSRFQTGHVREVATCSPPQLAHLTVFLQLVESSVFATSPQCLHRASDVFLFHFRSLCPYLKQV